MWFIIYFIDDLGDTYNRGTRFFESDDEIEDFLEKLNSSECCKNGPCRYFVDEASLHDIWKAKQYV